MAMKYYKLDDGRVSPHEYLPAGAITPKWGMTLTLTAGKLAVAGGTTAPKYLCMCECESAVTAGTEIPVCRIDDDIIYIAPLTEADTSLKVGDKVTLSADGLGVTATTTGGVFEITALHGTAVGDLVEGRFVAAE